LARPMDEAAKVVVVFFIWAIGVASVNAYWIYEVLWNEERARMEPGLPKKMTHAEFCEQLVYNLIFGRKTGTATVSSSSTISCFAHASSAEVLGVYDLTSNGGIMDYL
jgi:hypothetical protein